MGSNTTAGMMKLSIGVVAALSLVAVTGCKKKGGAGEAVAKMEEFSKAMCECKDKACADKVNADMSKWGTEMAKTAGKADEKPDPELAKKSADIMTKYTECMTKLMMAGAGGDTKGGMAGGDTKAGGDMKPAGGKSCEDQGGKKVGEVCELKTAAPVDVTFTGKYDTSSTQPEPGAVFKVTNKTDAPLVVGTVKVYGYDKAGTQLEFEAGGNKAKYFEMSKMGLVELGPKESKDFVSSIDKKTASAMDALQLEVTSWEVDKARFSRAVGEGGGGDAFEKRPKDGWK
jgi:hypothetical protein